MPHTALSSIIARVGQTLDQAANPADTDGQFLNRFARTRDEAAFTELVRRLGPMVLGVCRRVTRDEHLAEDAFQATFIVLARRCADVRPADSVRAWLYGVAVRTAREARSLAKRNRARESSVPQPPERTDVPTPSLDSDTLRVLDEEIANLSDRLRTAVILCELEGVSRKVAAARLGIPEGTLSSRLSQARKLLATALRGRGVTLSAGFAALAAIAVPASLLARTTASATTSGTLSPAVATLTNGALRMILVRKLKAIPVMLGLLAITLAGGWLTVAAPPPPVTLPNAPAIVSSDAPPQPGPVEHKTVSPNHILVARVNAYQILNPDGKVLAEFPSKIGQSNLSLRLSPDGRSLVACAIDLKRFNPTPDDDVVQQVPHQVTIRTVGKTEPDTTFELTSSGPLSFVWAADGKSVIATRMTANNPSMFESSRLVIATGKVEPFDTPSGAQVLDAHRDGKTFLICTANAVSVLTLGEANPRELTPVKGFLLFGTKARFSPDGKTVLLIDGDPERKEAHKLGQSQRPYLIDVATRKRELLPNFPENGTATGIAWSPDGKQLAYTWARVDDEKPKRNAITPKAAAKNLDAVLVVADADGKNPKTIVPEKTASAPLQLVQVVDWR